MLAPFVTSSFISVASSGSLRGLKVKGAQSFRSSSSSGVIEKTVRVLEWEKLCDSVASFAGTTLAQQATKEQLGKLNQSYEESQNLLAETSAAVQMLNYGSFALDFTAIDLVLVRSAIERASRGLAVEGQEAMAIVSLLEFSEALQLNIKAACKEDSDWYNRFMPLTQMIMELMVNHPLVKSIRQVLDDDGSVKDSASLSLKQSRDKVLRLEKKLFQLMDSLVRKALDTTSSLEVTNIGGRWCIKSGSDQLATTLNGLLLSSGSGVGNLVEPLSAVPLNDELEQARHLVAKAEEAVLLKLTMTMRADLDGICDLLDTIVQLDMVTARAKYSVSFGGTYPELLLMEDNDEYFGGECYSSGRKTLNDDFSNPSQREWTLYLPKAYHPLLLQQHRQNLKDARKDVSNAVSEIRRRKLQPEYVAQKEKSVAHIESLEIKVASLEDAHPIPVNFFISRKTRVLIITGPNTGGKTICLKTVGLAAMMAKSGLYVLASEPVRIPWFDSIFADIGDEQSLSQSLSTFSGHLRQISAIQAQSTSQSLVLLDEVGAGTNPLEGAALGMSLLESFAEAGALLTMATTHHGELKTLKYSNDAFENACMEFDEVNLKPTYKILWGVPGRSNAINIAERLGLPTIVLDNARNLYGSDSAEINEVIIEMEHFKQDYQKHVNEAYRYLIQSRELHVKLLAAKENITQHRTIQRYRMMGIISEVAAMARSTIHKRLRERRVSTTNSQQSIIVTNTQKNMVDNNQSTTRETALKLISNKNKVYVEDRKKSSEKQTAVPKIGDMVYVSSLGKKATVLKVENSKDEIVVQASNMKLRLKMKDLQIR